MKFYILSLGCAKNTVDAQGMATLLTRVGHQATDDPRRADLLIVNTCCFIEPAREESLVALREVAAAKKPHQRLLVAGCWPQREPYAILEAVPGVDGLLSTRRWADIASVVRQLTRPDRDKPYIHISDVPMADDAPDVPRIAVQGGSAYLKIADGCSRPCAFCAIPRIKGPAVSRPLERVLEDAAFAASQGAKELVLIAQDTTAYGRDLGLEDGLAVLLERLVERVPQVPWIRVMYAFPGAVTPRLMEGMARHPQVLPYLDIPLQHAHPAVLRRMRRPADVDWVRRTIAALRERMPEIALRTTFIVGYPGETEEEFAALLRFVEEMEFDRVGVFVYSHEEDTEAAALPDNVPADVKEERRARLMELQQTISLAKNRALIGRTLDVLIEGQGDGLSVGRTYRDAPEIDGLVLIPEELLVGEIVPIRITGAMEYDLVGEREA